MSILGRRLESNPDWTTSDRKLTTAAPILLVIDALLGLAGATQQSGGAVAVHVAGVVAGVAFVLAALWSGLPVVAQAAPEPKESVYRPGPRAPAIEPPRPSLTFMRVVLAMFVGVHFLAVIAAIAFGVLALIVLGLLWVVCSKH